jgi:hypothetical protein
LAIAVLVSAVRELQLMGILGAIESAAPRPEGRA